MKSTKVQRMAIVNQIIAEIASRGRNFLSHKGKVANYFTINNVLYYEHAYVTNGQTYSKVNTEGYFKAEHHGGTLRCLIKEFSAFIRTGNNTDGSEGRGGLWCTHWGYPQEDMQAIRKLATQLGYLPEQEKK